MYEKIHEYAFVAEFCNSSLLLPVALRSPCLLHLHAFQVGRYEEQTLSRSHEPPPTLWRVGTAWQNWSDIVHLSFSCYAFKWNNQTIWPLDVKSLPWDNSTGSLHKTIAGKVKADHFAVQLIIYKNICVAVHTFMYMYSWEIISRCRCIFLYAWLVQLWKDN